MIQRIATKVDLARFVLGGSLAPDGYIAAIAASRSFIVATRDAAPYEAACVTVINPWKEA